LQNHTAWDGHNGRPFSFSTKLFASDPAGDAVKLHLSNCLRPGIVTALRA